MLNTIDTPEKMPFTVDPSIIFSLINAQAGSLPKACLEGHMNAEDAGAKSVDITITESSFMLKDDGKGFTSRQEIVEYFAKFGTPHKEGDAKFGRFRMGRGQMMAFGSTVWRTGEFEMTVDVRARGLEFDLKTGLPLVKGCTITGALYNPLSLHELNDVIRELGELLKFASLPVMLNGKKISTNPKKLKWDIETNDAYIKLTSASDLKVYNLGVLVCGYNSYRFGTGGVVVAKQQLQVNFARNDVLVNQCDVWGRVARQIKQLSGVKVAKKSVLTEAEREFLARRIRAGEVDSNDATNAKVITTATGTQVTLRSLLHCGLPLTVAKSKGDRLAERLHRAKVAFALSPETLTRFGVDSAEELVAALKGTLPSWMANQFPDVQPFEQVATGYSKAYDVIPEQEHTPEEKLAMQQLSRANYVLALSLKRTMSKVQDPNAEKLSMRTLRVGKSDAALAWTNGVDYIHIDRKFLLSCARKGIDGWFRLLSVLVHEYCHIDAADLDGHEHSQEFYELYETLMTEPSVIASEAARRASNFTSEALKKGLNVSSKASRQASFAPTDAGSAAAVCPQGA